MQLESAVDNHEGHVCSKLVAIIEETTELDCSPQSGSLRVELVPEATRRSLRKEAAECARKPRTRATDDILDVTEKERGSHSKTMCLLAEQQTEHTRERAVLSAALVTGPRRKGKKASGLAPRPCALHRHPGDSQKQEHLGGVAARWPPSPVRGIIRELAEVLTSSPTTSPCRTPPPSSPPRPSVQRAELGGNVTSRCGRSERRTEMLGSTSARPRENSPVDIPRPKDSPELRLEAHHMSPQRSRMSPRLAACSPQPRVSRSQPHTAPCASPLSAAAVSTDPAEGTALVGPDLARQLLAAAEAAIHPSRTGVHRDQSLPVSPPPRRRQWTAGKEATEAIGLAGRDSDSRWVLALVMGHTPRPDLLGPIRETLSGHVDVVEVGALDGTTDEQLAALSRHGADDALLVAKLRDGRQVSISESMVTPLLQVKLSAAVVYSRTPPVAALLLTTAALPQLRAPHGMTLLRPFECAVSVVEALGVLQAVLLVPCEGQQKFAEARWRSRLPYLDVAAVPLSTNMPLEQMERIVEERAAPGKGVLVLDFLGHPSSVVPGLRSCLPGRFILDTGILACRQLAAIL